ncbi:MAG: hypothetical protein DIU76_03555 [Bacillota bacterium]|nr:MAG: hypothetical protein DIU76_03555 [Bacillota bacterium]
MALRIARDRTSNRPWGDVDKSAIWQRLKRALQEQEEGAAAAVREMYAVVKAEVNADLTQADCWGPHHEIQGDTLVLNRNGVIAAAQALAGARAEPNLTPEQRRTAARHLLRHYRELELEPPESLREAAGQGAEGETVRLSAMVSGEIRVEDVPLAPWVDLEALKAGDPDPLEVVVEIPAGRSKRGWVYTPQALQQIVGEVMSQGLPGFLGHQKPEDVDHEFPEPVTHWVGALWRDGKAYIRGVIDPAADKLKRWLRAKAVRTVSIFGVPTLRQVGGETHVVDYKPLSIDWTPLGRAGMPTAVVAMGEMDAITAPAVQPAEPKEGGNGMGVQDLLAELRKHRPSVAQIVGEMGWKAEDVVRELGVKLEDVAPVLAGEQWSRLQAAEKAVGEMARLVGMEGADPDRVVKRVQQALEAEQAARQAQREQLLEKVVGEMVPLQAARPLVRRLVEPRLDENADEAAIRKAVGEMLQQDDVRQALEAGFAGWVPPNVPGPDGGGRPPRNGLVVRRVRI